MSCDGHAIGDGELCVSRQGELQVRGPELFVGYLVRRTDTTRP